MDRATGLLLLVLALLGLYAYSTGRLQQIIKDLTSPSGSNPTEQGMQTLIPSNIPDKQPLDLGINTPNPGEGVQIDPHHIGTQVMM